METRKSETGTLAITLAVETSQGGGSVSILEGKRELASWVGEKKLGKAEVILEAVQMILVKSGVKKRDLNWVAVSEGPGSLMGVRIGLALAKGFKDALGVDLRGVSVLEALAFENRFPGKILSVVGLRKGEFCWRFFEFGSSLELVGSENEKVGTLGELHGLLGKFVSDINMRVVLSGDLYQVLAFEIKDFEELYKQMVRAENVLARCIGRYSFQLVGELSQSEGI